MKPHCEYCMLQADGLRDGLKGWDIGMFGPEVCGNETIIGVFMEMLDIEDGGSVGCSGCGYIGRRHVPCISIPF